MIYKNLAYFIVNGFIDDNVSSIPTYSCVVERTSFDIDGNSLYANIGGDCNPAYALYYILTQIIGIDKSLIDISSFLSIAKALYDDRFSISFTMSSQNEAKEYIEEFFARLTAFYV